jgi:hypothetical protein
MTGWTIETLKEHFDVRIAALQDAVSAALSASDKAINKAEGAAEKRADASNEIRQAMLDQQKTFASREALDALDKRMDLLDGRSQGVGISATVIGWIVMASIAGAAVAAAFLKN